MAYAPGAIDYRTALLVLCTSTCIFTAVSKDYTVPPVQAGKGRQPVATVASGKMAKGADGCPSQHVELIDGTCERSWLDGNAVKPPYPTVRKLCAVDPASLKMLQDYAAQFPADAWLEPAAKFMDLKNPIDYRHVTFHFPEVRNKAYSEYFMYHSAKDFHPLVEPILLNITSRYNYADEAYPPQPGFVTKSIPRLMFAKLGPGSAQITHRDMGYSALPPHKIHIPITDGGGDRGGNADFVFHSGKGRQGSQGDEVRAKLDVGFAYEVNNLLPHHAANDGTRDRIHLLIEFYPREVSSSWSEEAGPLKQSDKQAKEKKERQAMTPEQLERHWADKAKNNSDRSARIHDAIAIGMEEVGKEL